ncbi:hypothetical protein ACJ73_08326, partial [Blastomyces percursus]
AAWTDDTDHALLIILSYLRHNGKQLSPKDVAHRLHVWVGQGLRCLDRPPCGLGATVGTTQANELLLHREYDFQVVRSIGYLDNPAQVAYDCWVKSNRTVAPNGSLMRTHPLGIICLASTLPETFQIAADFSAITHADPRCIVSCCAVTGLIRGILRGEVLNEENVDEIIAEAFAWVDGWVRRRAGGASGSDCTPEENELHEQGALLEMYEYTRHANATSFKELELDDSRKMGYVYKTFGAAVLALRLGMRQTGYRLKDRSDDGAAKPPHATDVFEKVITELTFEGGDADTNACVAGALLGCLFGYNSLPPQWRDGMVRLDWVVGKCEALNQMVGVQASCVDTGQRPRYRGSQDPDTAIDGGKGLLNAEELNKREREFIYRYLLRSNEATEQEKGLEAAKSVGIFSKLKEYLSK